MARVPFAALLALAFSGSAAFCPAQAGPRAVVELFTSQGCSSCPAADRVLNELAQDPSVIAISEPVDYWDYLGWKDTLGNPHHTARQRGYSHRRADREVYTPQAIVNGMSQVLGSDKTAITRAATQAEGKALPLPVTLNADGDRLAVSVPAGKAEQHAEVWLCAVTKNVSVSVARGENHGRTLTYTNVARRWTKLGDWTGKAESWDVPLSMVKTEGADAAAVFVQNGNPEKLGMMLGAAFAPLP